MAKIKILSLNVHIWVRDLNPHKWEQFCLPRTIKMLRLFRREKPDIIGLQERIQPLGKVLLGLFSYKVFSSRESRIPVYVRKSVAKAYDMKLRKQNLGTAKDNGHGVTIVTMWHEGNPIYIQNCHYSLTDVEFMNELQYGFLPNTIFFGDLNRTKEKFASKFHKHRTSDQIVFADKTPTGQPTYMSYGEPVKMSDIDHIGYVAYSGFAPKITCKVLPDRLSDHYPILAEVEL